MSGCLLFHGQLGRIARHVRARPAALMYNISCERGMEQGRHQQQAVCSMHEGDAASAGARATACSNAPNLLQDAEMIHAITSPDAGTHSNLDSAAMACGLRDDEHPP